MANLTPEQLARLRQMVQQGGQAEYYDEASGRSFMPIFAPGHYDGENYIPGEVTGFRGYEWAPGMYSDNFELNGKQYDQFDAQGNQTGQGTWEGLKKNSAMDTLLPLAMVALPFAATMFPTLGAAMSFGTNPVLSGASATGFAPGAAGAVGGGLSGMPGGAAMDVGGFEGLTAADVGLGGTTAPGAAGGSGAFLGEGVASGVPAWDAAAKTAGLSLSGAGTAAGLLDGASKWLGPAATLLGAAAGAKGQENSQTQTRDIPEWLKPSVMGLLGNTNDLLARQMAPGALQGYDDMQRVGRGLLGAPVAGNGFSLFRGR